MLWPPFADCGYTIPQIAGSRNIPPDRGICAGEEMNVDPRECF
jgi:hypothetical protein